MRWPSERIEAIYKAITQREAQENIEQQRLLMVAAMFSNPNWDGEHANKRSDVIRDLNRHFDAAIEEIYDPKPEPEIDWSNPFYSAALRGLERTRRKYQLDGAGGAALKAARERDEEQMQAREKSRKEIDQL